MLSRHNLSSRSIPITNHSFDTLQPQELLSRADNHFQSWRSRRKSSTFDSSFNPEQTSSPRRAGNRSCANRESPGKADDGVLFSDEAFHQPPSSAKRLLGWKVYDPHISAKRELVMARPVYLQLPCRQVPERLQSIVPPRPNTSRLPVPQIMETIRPQAAELPLKRPRHLQKKIVDARQYTRVNFRKHPYINIKAPVQSHAKPKTADNIYRDYPLDGSLRPWDHTEKWSFLESSDYLRKTPSPMPMMTTYN